MKTHRRFLVSLGAGALALLVGGAVLGVSVGTEYLESEYLTSGLVYGTVSDLTTASDAVVRAGVVEVGRSHRLPVDPPVAAVASTPAGEKKGTAQ